MVLRAWHLLVVIPCAACGDDARGASDAATVVDSAGASDDAATSPLVLLGMWGGYGTEPGQFVEPSSVELDSAGLVYVAGHENRVQKFTAAGELLLIWGTGGTGDGQFNHPHGLAVDRARGDLVYVGDQENGRVQVFTTDGTFLRLWSDPQFQHLHDVGIDPGTGDIYVGDYELDVLQRFTSTGVPLAELGGTGTGPGQFDGVWGVSTDSQGNVYVADTFNRRVQKLDVTGAFVAEWLGFGANQFLKPTGVFVDADDVVHVCDSLAQTIGLFDTDGVLLERWFLPDVLGEDSEPEDIVLDATGDHIYVAEVLKHRVYHLTRRRD
ncbi:MAG: hypothetical protein KA297_00315 [Kofleriaceae bacterium]|jgi:DNA-binding beta-propeller fold protein YncE|nr:hypothetical protein [Kofleriaceae bacterium]